MFNIKYAFKGSSLTEKIIFIILSVITIISGIAILKMANSYIVSDQPAKGGSFTEGVIGTPRFINPLLELSDADRDLTYLVYSGLMAATPSGELIPDLAQDYILSDDGLTYTFTLKNNIYFHDGVKVTTDDVEYTIDMAQNSILRSPKRNNWLGVTVRKIDNRTIIFELKQPYSPFLENLTLGILPKHIWSSATAEEYPFSPFNIEAIGSGPYKIENITRNRSGLPVAYQMIAFNKYALGEPYITKLNINFYNNEKELTSALEQGKIDSTSSLAPQNIENLKKDLNFNTKKVSLPRIFGLFFNQNQNKVFLNKEVRTALNMTVDKNRIVSEVLNGYGETIDSPLPKGLTSGFTPSNGSAAYNRDEAIASAKAVLTKAGWKYNETAQVWEKTVDKKSTLQLAFSIATSNTTDLKRTAEILKEDWTMLGAKVEVETFDPSDLNQTIISQRKYDSLLFGQVVGRSLDLFAFWHSSQRLTGYNIAMYTNSKVDKLLEEARQTSDPIRKIKDYSAFEVEIANDIPAIFIYSPQFVYALPNKIKGFETGLINNRSERFEQINKWFVETDKVWKFLVKN